MLKCLAGSGPGCLLLRRALRREASLCYVTSHTVLIMALSEQLPEVHPAMPRTSATCCFFHSTPHWLCSGVHSHLHFSGRFPLHREWRWNLNMEGKKKKPQIIATVGYLADFLKGKSRALWNSPVKMWLSQGEPHYFNLSYTGKTRNESAILSAF